MVDNEKFTIDDLNEVITTLNSDNVGLHFAEDTSTDDVINHMPYNSGIFYENMESEGFLEKSVSEDITFSKTLGW